jgi:hypothetical protein
VKLKVTVTQETIYEIPDSDVLRIYGTTDPMECARIEAENKPDELIAFAYGKGLTVTTSHSIMPV